MYVRQENLSQCGGFAVEIPSTSTKKEVYRSHVQTFSYVSRKIGNPVAQPEFETIQSDDATIQQRRMFLHCFLKSSQENLLLPSYSSFYASLTKPVDKQKARFHVTLPDPPKKAVIYDVMQRCKQAADLKSMPFVQIIGDQPAYDLIEKVNMKPSSF